MKIIQKACFIAITLGVIIVGNKFISYASNEYNIKYINGTKLNGVDISYLTVEQALNKYIDMLNNLVIEIETTDNIQYIKLSDISNNIENLGDIRNNLVEMLSTQDINIFNLLKIKDNQNIELHIELDINKDKLIAELFNLDLGIDYNTVENPRDAYISYNADTGLYEIIPEEYGYNNTLENISTNLINKLQDRVINKDRIKISLRDLTRNSLADKPITYKELETDIDKLNTLTNFTLNIGVNDKAYKIDKEYVLKYLITQSINEKDIKITDRYYISYDAIKDIVSDINRGVTTMGLPHNFKTHTGKEIIVPGGNWGWWLNSSETANIIYNKLKDIISTQEVENKYTEYSLNDVSWYQTAPYYGDIEFKNYVEIDLTNQHLYIYKNGELKGDWGIVSGLSSDTSRATPPGIFKLTYKQLDATLTGENYSTPVKYWMPFNGDIGIHDATWQSSFGGNVYTYRGSHGCINVSLEGAREIYKLIDESYAIICYK